MSNKGSVFTKLPAPPYINTIRPQYWSFNGNCIIVTSGTELWLYDLEKQIITKKWKCTNIIHSINTVCIDLQDNLLYALVGLRDAKKLISVDLIKNEWNELRGSENVAEFNNIFPLPSMDKLYIDACRNNVTAEDDQYFYRKSTNQLFRKRHGEISVSDVNTNDKSMSDWKIYKKHMPKKGADFFWAIFSKLKMILAFDQIIFYFVCNEWTIWCLDLDHDERWYQTTHGMPNFGYTKDSYAIKDDDNNLHLINFGANKKNRYHFKASLFDLIPTEIVKLNRKRCELLIIGFVKEFERKHKPIFVPMYLKKLIVKVYPIFL